MLDGREGRVEVGPELVGLLEARHRWEGDRIPTGLLRLSVGLEEPDELWADLDAALAAV